VIKLIVCFAGMHGVGKTTLAKKLDELGFKVFYDDEPSPEGDLFKRELKNIEKYSRWVDEAKKMPSNSIVFLERHPYSVMIYTHVFYNLGWISESEVAEILMRFSKKFLGFRADLTIKIMPPFNKVFERIVNRNRQGFGEEKDQIYSSMVYDEYARYPFNDKECVEVKFFPTVKHILRIVGARLGKL